MNYKKREQAESSRNQLEILKALYNELENSKRFFDSQQNYENFMVRHLSRMRSEVIINVIHTTTSSFYNIMHQKVCIQFLIYIIIFISLDSTRGGEISTISCECVRDH